MSSPIAQLNIRIAASNAAMIRGPFILRKKEPLGTHEEEIITLLEYTVFIDAKPKSPGISPIGH